jgi:hypothetical protein
MGIAARNQSVRNGQRRMGQQKKNKTNGHSNSIGEGWAGRILWRVRARELADNGRSGWRRRGEGCVAFSSDEEERDEYQWKEKRKEQAQRLVGKFIVGTLQAWYVLKQTGARHEWKSRKKQIRRDQTMTPVLSAKYYVRNVGNEALGTSVPDYTVF